MEELKSEARRTWSMILRFAADLMRAVVCALSGLGFTWLIGLVVGTDNQTYEVSKFILNMVFVGGALLVSFFGVWSFCMVSYRSARNSGG